jgi:tartrate-resistant acid phosphatase type 5
MSRFSILAVFMVILAGCGGSGGGAGGNSQAAQFVAFGDAGTGSERQIAVGNAMAEVCAARGCDFALELGDNFYASGVTSVDDAQFQQKFETPYEKLKLPIYVTLGNHDNSRGPGEGSDNARGEYQVEYHYLAGRASDKWRMPSRYYSFSWPATGTPLVEFFSLDSNPLTAIVSDPDPQWNPLAYGAEQTEWLSDGLQKSRARWKIAFAHHPYLSNGLHGNAGNYDGVPEALPVTTNGSPYKAMLNATLCQHADLMIAGHDHDLQWLKPVERCPKVQHFVSGAAEGPRPFGDANRNAAYWQQDNTLGFFWFRIEADRFTAAAYTLDANLQLPKDAQGRPVPVFEQTLPKPR